MAPLTSADPEVVRILRERFQIKELRGPQGEAIDAVLAGKDVLVTMPTGAGKSLVYQLPAVVLPGMTLVVSPLIALMKDQVDALTEKGVAANRYTPTFPGTRASKAELLGSSMASKNTAWRSSC